MQKGRKTGIAAALVILWLAVGLCHADPILTSGYSLSLFSLGTVPGTTGTIYGGLGFNGNDNLLLAAYNPAQQQTEKIYSAPVVRNAAGQITGFGAPSSFNVSITDDNTFGNNVAGGLTFLPNGTFLYSVATENYIGQYSGGTSNLTAISDPFDPSAVLGGLGYIPVAGLGTILVATFTDGDAFKVNTTPNGLNPFYGLQLGPRLATGIDANSFAFERPFPGFQNGGFLVGDVANSTLALYGVDANGNVVKNNSVTLLNGNNEAIGYGVVVDPRTGNILVTGSNADIWQVTLPTPEPGTIAGVACGIAIMLAIARRRRTTGSKS